MSDLGEGGQDDWLYALSPAEGRLPELDARQWVELLSHGTMRAGLYAPRGVDDQQPHDQDEIYVVMRGRGVFVRGSERRPFGPGDLLFVPAGMAHRFEEFTDDFATWVVFWGPSGGED